MAANDNHLTFPQGFLWGASTAAYQIEGATTEGGRGLSIWDTFCRLPGKIYQDQNGDMAADHYHRWKEDVALMARLGLSAYRFSVAWPRIQPQGVGAPNRSGLGFYDRLVDALLSQNITPFLTLYHWDLPQALQDKGGWANRQTAYHFAEFAALVARRLGDRVRFWTTHNEPLSTSMMGYFLGEHAPGLTNPSAALQSVHHILLSHGLATQVLRADLPAQAQIGITLNLNPVYPVSDSAADQQAARRIDLILNRLFLDPLLRGQYHPDVLRLLGRLFPTPRRGDLETIAAPLDFMGINYYTRAVIRFDRFRLLIQADQVHPPGNEYSQMWEIFPTGLYELLLSLWAEFGGLHPGLKLYLTENGAPVPDGIDFDGRVRDERRIRYLYSHLEQVHRALQQGVPLAGYFVWSLMDNFEWAYGYRMRFGLIYVDYETQARTLKDSAHWYAEVIRSNGLARNSHGQAG